MRIKLKKGKQKELLNTFKNNNHLTWKQLSALLNVGKTAIIEWSREANLIPLEIYKILDNKKKYKKYILEIKEETWGKSKGGIKSKGSLKEIKIPEKSNGLAELVGIILGDGNIFSYKKGKKIGVYSLRIAGNCKEEKDYHINYVKPLCENLFDLNAKIQEYPQKNERFVSLHSRELVKYLKDIGLRSGDKLLNVVTMPKWIFNNDNFLKACLRGLIDTDGCVSRMSKKDPNLIRIGFTNYNNKLLEDVRVALTKLGFHPSKISYNRTNLSRKEDIVKYLNLIGFSNSKHQKRFDKFKNSPVV